MGSTVHRPGEVQAEHVAEQTLMHKGMVPGFIPAIDRHQRGQHKAEHYLQHIEVFLMELYDGIRNDIGHVDLTAATQHFRMLQHH